MKLNFLKRAGVLVSSLALLATLAAPSISFAAVDRAVVAGISAGSGPGTLFADAHFMDGSSEVDEYNVDVPLASVSTNQQLVDTANASVQAYATLHGYTLGSVTWPYLTPAQINSLISAASSSLATVARTGSYTDLSSKPTIPTVSAMTFTNPARSLNTSFQISTTSAAFVSYTVDVATSLSLSGGTTGTVTLQYADDSGFTTNVKTVQSSVNGQTGTLTIGLGLNQTSTAAVTGMVPVGKYVKIVTANTTGTPTFTYRAAQEVLLPSN